MWMPDETLRIHPQSLTWNLKMMVSKGISFSKGLVSGSMLNFGGLSFGKDGLTTYLSHIVPYILLSQKYGILFVNSIPILAAFATCKPTRWVH